MENTQLTRSAEINVIPEMFDQKRFPSPRVKWEGKCAEYCSV